MYQHLVYKKGTFNGEISPNPVTLGAGLKPPIKIQLALKVNESQTVERAWKFNFASEPYIHYINALFSTAKNVTYNFKNYLFGANSLNLCQNNTKNAY
jgi:hypothetical protein